MIFLTSTQIHQKLELNHLQQHHIIAHCHENIPSNPKETIRLKDVVISFTDQNLKYPQFHIRYTDYSWFAYNDKKNYNIYININDAQIFIPNVPNSKENIYLLSNYITNGSLGYANVYNISIFIARSSATDPQSDPKTFIWTYKYIY